MAYGLLDGSDDRHLYRHDLESLFYIVLIVVTLRDPTSNEGEEWRIVHATGIQRVTLSMLV